MDILLALGGTFITGIFSVIAVILTNKSGNDKITNDIRREQAVTNVEIKKDIQELTREVREHNNFAKRMPVVEEQIKVINNRLKDLERKGGD